MKQQVAHSATALVLTLAAGIMLLLASSELRAMDGPTSFVLDLPCQPNLATPAWLAHPVTPNTTFATLDLPICPPDANASLLITVFFEEKEGGFLRVNWQGAVGAQVLCDNLYEGIAMGNQRKLLITSATMQGSGTLHFQCGASILGVQRIKLEWLESQSGLVSPQIQDLLVTPASGPTQSAQTLNGLSTSASDPVWRDQFANVPITAAAERIDQGVEFSVQLDQLPKSGRLTLKESGLPLGQHLVVWLNQQRAGTITPTVPDLMDEGFMISTNPPDMYVGWREGSFYVPVSSLKTGVNTVQFSIESDAPSSSNENAGGTTELLPLAVKDVVLQLNYPPAQSAADVSSPPSPATSTPVSIPSPAPTPDIQSSTKP